MEEQLRARRSQAENDFNELQKQKDQKQTEMNTINEEMFRLQGEYRLLNDLLNKKKSKISPKAEVLDVTSVEGS